MMNGVEVPIFIRLGNHARPIPGLPRPEMDAMRDLRTSSIQASGAGNVDEIVAFGDNVFVQGVHLQNNWGKERQQQ